MIKQRKTWKSDLNVQENALSKIDLTLGTLMLREKLIHPYHLLDIQQIVFSHYLVLFRKQEKDCHVGVKFNCSTKAVLWDDDCLSTVAGDKMFAFGISCLPWCALYELHTRKERHKLEP